LSADAHGNKVNGNLEIAHHAANARQRLTILLAQHRSVTPKKMELLGDDRAHPAKMSGTRLSLQRFRKRGFFDEYRTIVSIHCGNTWAEQEIDTGVSTKFIISFVASGVPLVIAHALQLNRAYQRT